MDTQLLYRRLGVIAAPEVAHGQLDGDWTLAATLAFGGSTVEASDPGATIRSPPIDQLSTTALAMATWTAPA